MLYLKFITKQIIVCNSRKNILNIKGKKYNKKFNGI